LSSFWSIVVSLLGVYGVFEEDIYGSMPQ